MVTHRPSARSTRSADVMATHDVDEAIPLGDRVVTKQALERG
jgi:ABC-type nitrate/sulfonate/bicarbonate transport system ATPase subunit